MIKLCDWFSANIMGKALFRFGRQTNNNDVTSWIMPQLDRKLGTFSKKASLFGVRPLLTFLFIVSHECRAYEIVKWKLNKLILCDMSAFEQKYSQVCL